MSKSFNLFAAALVFGSSSSAQFLSFNKSYGGPNEDFGYGLVRTNDGGYLVVGSTGSFGTAAANFRPNAYVLRTNAQGEPLWTRAVGGSGSDLFNGVVQASNGDHLAVGVVDQGSNNSDILLSRIAMNGAILWNRRIGTTTRNEIGNKIIGLGDEEFVIVGSRLQFGGGVDGNVLVTKVNGQGGVIWSAEIGTMQQEDPRDVVRTPDGGYLVIGVRYTFPTSQAFIVKLDELGVFQWDKVFQVDGGYISGISIANAQWDTFLLSCAVSEGVALFGLDDSGGILWNRAYRFGEALGGLHIVPTASGNFLISGGTWQDGSTVQQSTSLLVNGLGDPLAFKAHGEGLANSYGRAAVINEDGSFTILSDIALQGGDISLVRCSTEELGLGTICYAQDATVEEVPPSTISVVQLYATLPSPALVSSELGGTATSGGAAAIHCTNVGLLPSEEVTTRLHVFPNPTMGPITLDYPSNMDNAEVQLINATGQLVLHMQLSKAQDLDIGELSPGFYLLRLIDEKGQEKSSVRVVRE
jgi:hypothetical protein